MYQTKMFKYKKDGVVKVSLNVEENAEVFDEITLLYPEDGKELVHLKDGETFGVVWLQDGDKQENYTEVKLKENV